MVWVIVNLCVNAGHEAWVLCQSNKLLTAKPSFSNFQFGFVFEMEAQVAEDGLELLILLPQLWHTGIKDVPLFLNSNFTKL